jgi:hypothetical protein
MNTSPFFYFRIFKKSFFPLFKVHVSIVASEIIFDAAEQIDRVRKQSCAYLCLLKKGCVGDTIDTSDSLMPESYENLEAGEVRTSPQDPLGDIPQEVIQSELDANPLLLANILEHLENNQG